jgi:subtilase family serine protease
MKLTLALISLLVGTLAMADVTIPAGFSIVTGGTPDPTVLQMTDLGPVDPNQTMVVDIVMASKDPAGLAAYATSVTDPASPNYRHFLTPQEFCSSFGGDPSAMALATAYFAAKKIVLAQNSGCTNLIGTATTTQVNSAFLTNMKSYSSPATSTQSALNVITFATPLMLPSTFVSAISDVVSLTQVKVVSTP